MNVPTTTAPGRIADPRVQTNLPQAPPPRLLPVVVEKPAAMPATAGNDALRAKAQRSQELDAELAAANRKLADDRHEVRFEYDRDASELIVRLIDLETDTVLRQFPSDEALRVARLVKSGKPLISLQA